MGTNDTPNKGSQKRFLAKPPVLMAGFVAILIILMVVFNLLGGEPEATSADITNPSLVAAGQKVYAQTCAGCHGPNLEGQPNWEQELPTGGRPAPPHDASGHTWHHNDRSLFMTVKFGGQITAPAGVKSNMPGFQSSLSDQEIWAVLAYIKSTWPPELQAAQREGHQ